MWYILRHGQTLSNNLKISQGHQNSLLNLCGIVQAEAIGYRLFDSGENFSKYKFITSPMIRTRHTIQLIIEILGLTGKIEVLEEALLLSRSKGLLEGMMKTDIEKFYPNEIQDRKNDPWNYTPLYGGESRKSAYNRIKKFIKKYKDESNLVICTHSGIVKTLKNILSGLSEEDIKTLVKEKSEEKIQSYFYAWDGNNIAKI